MRRRDRDGPAHQAGEYFLAARDARSDFPRTGLCRWRGGFPLAELGVELLKDALPVALASSFAVERACPGSGPNRSIRGVARARAYVDEP
jgi:hypothetical protein